MGIELSAPRSRVPARTGHLFSWREDVVGATCRGRCCLETRELLAARLMSTATTSESATSGKRTPRMATMATNPLAAPGNSGAGGTPRDPAGRRFHHIVNAATASSTIAIQPSRRAALPRLLASEFFCPRSPSDHMVLASSKTPAATTDSICREIRSWMKLSARLSVYGSARCTALCTASRLKRRNRRVPQSRMNGLS
jgi:hypothetical protein